MTDHNDPIEAALAAALEAIATWLQVRGEPQYAGQFKDSVAAGNDTKAALNALIAVVRREQAASMPCYRKWISTHPAEHDFWVECADLKPHVTRCPACLARAEKADAKEEAQLEYEAKFPVSDETMEDVVDAHVIDHLVNGPATHSELMTKAREVDAEIARLRGDLRIQGDGIRAAVGTRNAQEQALQQAHAERDALAAAIYALAELLPLVPNDMGRNRALVETAREALRSITGWELEALTRMGEKEVTT